MPDPQEPRQPMEKMLEEWARRVRAGQGRTEPPAGRQLSARDIHDVWRGEDGCDERLAHTAADGFTPWQDEPRRLFAWRGALLAAAACLLPIMLLIGYVISGSLRPEIGPLALHVGYSDFGDRARGDEDLRGGSAATIFVTLPEAGLYSIVVLDQALNWTTDQSDVPVQAGRIEIPWQLPEATGVPLDETVCVVVHDAAWDAFDVADELGDREERCAALEEAIARGGGRVECVTYRVAP